MKALLSCSVYFSGLSIWE